MTEKNYYFSSNVLFVYNNGKLDKVDLLECDNVKILTYVCPKKTKIPNIFKNLEELYYHHDIDEIPEYFPNLKILYCNNTGVKKIPYFPKLEYLDCSHNPELKEIPNEYFNIKTLKYNYTKIKK